MKTHASQIFLERTFSWNSECSFSFKTVESSSCETALSTSRLQICHLQNLCSSFVKQSIHPFPIKKDILRSISLKGAYLNYINFQQHLFLRFLTFKSENSRKLIPFSKTNATSYSSFFSNIVVSVLKKNIDSVKQLASIVSIIRFGLKIRQTYVRKGLFQRNTKILTSLFVPLPIFF